MKQKTNGMRPCVELIADLYLSERNRYVRMQRGSHPFVPKRNGESMPLSDNVLTSHLAGKYAIAVYASSEGSKFIDAQDILLQLYRLSMVRNKIWLRFPHHKLIE